MDGRASVMVDGCNGGKGIGASMGTMLYALVGGAGRVVGIVEAVDVIVVSSAMFGGAVGRLEGVGGGGVALVTD